MLSCWVRHFECLHWIISCNLHILCKKTRSQKLDFFWNKNIYSSAKKTSWMKFKSPYVLSHRPQIWLWTRLLLITSWSFSFQSTQPTSLLAWLFRLSYVTHCVVLRLLLLTLALIEFRESPSWRYFAWNRSDSSRAENLARRAHHYRGDRVPARGGSHDGSGSPVHRQAVRNLSRRDTDDGESFAIASSEDAAALCSDCAMTVDFCVWGEFFYFISIFILLNRRKATEALYLG